MGEKRAEQAFQPVVIEVSGVEAIGRRDDLGSQPAGEHLCGLAAWRVTVEEDGAAALSEELELVLRGVQAQQGDSGDAELVEAEHLPGTLDDDQRLRSLQAVPAVEQPAPGHARWDDPLAPGVGVEAAARVAQGQALGVVEAHCDAVRQHSPPVPGAHLEEAGRPGVDAPAGQEGVPDVEGQPAGVGSEGLGRRRSGPGCPRQPSQDASSAPVVGAVEAADQVDHVAARAAGEAVPEVAAEVDDEGGGVVAAMHGTGTDQAVAPPPQPVQQPPAAEHLLDRDALAEVGQAHEGGYGLGSDALAARPRVRWR